MKNLPRTYARPPSGVALVLCIALVAGCNVYEGLYEEGQSDNPEHLLEDARIALQQNRPDAAVTHLRKALSITEGDNSLLRKQIQIKLASAVLQRQDLNVLTLKNIVRNFDRAIPTETLSFGKTQGEVCLFPQSHAREAFDPAKNIDFTRLGSPASEAALAESQDLIARIFSGEETEADPSFPCEDKALNQAIADLQEQGMGNEDLAEALVDFAVAHTTVAYLDIIGSGGDDATFFYVTPPATSTEYIGLCFTSEPTCISTVGETISNLTRLDCSTRVLQKRADLLNSTTAQELADLSRASYENMAAGLEDPTCLVY